MSSRTAWRRWGVVATVVVLVVVVAGVGFGVSRSTTSTYDEVSRERFIAACTADGGDDVAPACECLYTAITEKIAYERFEEVSDQLTAARDAGEPIVLPDDIAALVPACQVPA